MPFIYLINPDLCNFLKIGKWSGSEYNLKARYQTYYGKQQSIYLFECNDNDYHTYEKDILINCSHYSLDPRCELFKKDSLQVCLTICSNICKTSYNLLERNKKINKKKLDIFNNKHVLIIKILKMISIKTLYTKQDILNFSDDITKMYDVIIEYKLDRGRITTALGSKLILFKFNALLNLCNKKIRVNNRRQLKLEFKGKKISVSDYIIKTKKCGR
jgi:hypothetical protein